MAKSADIGSKRLISLAPQRWVQWVTQIPDVQIREIITSEFQWISRESDVLVSAYTPEDGEFLVLNELQLRYKAQMPRRMRAYAALAEEHYNKPTYPVLINILPPPPTVIITNRYESEFRGLIARQDYHVINLWEVEAEIAFQQPLTSLIPFVPVLKGGGEESIVREALQVLRSDQKLNDLEPLLAFFASFVLEIPVVQQIMRWDMVVLEQSPWYQQILQQGMQQGLLSGIALGLELKFGPEGLELMPEIRQILDVAKLEAIQSAIKTANSVDELRQIL